MTTPERLRARQRRESALIALLAGALVVVFVYFQGQQEAQQKCLTTFITVNSETGAIRSRLAERESDATRRIILQGTSSTLRTREQVQRLRAQYVRALANIDQAREDHPVKPFPKGVCD